MARRCLLNISKHASRQACSVAGRRSFPTLQAGTAITRAVVLPQPAFRSFTISARSFKGLSPESENPPPKTTEPEPEVLTVTELDNETYHEISESALDEIMEKLEDLQEKREDVDFETSDGVLNITITQKGTWVINKQPPNKQIWLSSPLTGPKRYDWVVKGEGQDEKEGGGIGEWIYLRDGSTLTDLLAEEIGIQLVKPLEPSQE